MTNHIATIYEGLYGPSGAKLLTRPQLKYFISRIGAPSVFQTILEQSAVASDAFRVFRTSTGKDGGYWTRDAADAITSGSQSITDYAVFSNQLADISAKPSASAHFGRYQTFTFECDDPDPQKFREQVRWFVPTDRARPTDCPVGKLFVECCQWPDFYGISVVYSASKSFHIHVVMDAAPVAPNFQVLEPATIRAGYKTHWWKLSDVVNGVLGEQKWDKTLDEYEKLRRIPNGIRVIDKGNHIAGIPVGTVMPQPVIWEKFGRQGISGSKSTGVSFFDHTQYVAPVVRSSQPTQYAGNGAFLHAADDLKLDAIHLTHCEQRMREYFPSSRYPAFARFEWLNTTNGSGWFAKFFDHVGDKNPNALMGPSCKQVKGSSGPSFPRLPRNLSKMMWDWKLEAECLRMKSRPLPTVAPAIDDSRSEVERIFAETVCDRATAASGMQAVLEDALDRKHRYGRRLTLVRGHEGVGKTTTLFEIQAGAIAAQKPKNGFSRKRPSMYAFLDYRAAAEKCADFNSRRKISDFVGVIVKSVSQLYKEFGGSPMSVETAARSGAASMWDAYAQQPGFVEFVDDYNRALWREIGDRLPTFFTVHEVAHSWAKMSFSNAIHAKDWPTLSELIREGDCDRQTVNQSLTDCYDSLRLDVLVHDEIEIGDFVTAIPLEAWCDCQRLFDANPTYWRGTGKKPLDQSFRYLSQSGYDVAFETVMEVSSVPYEQWDVVEAKNNGYGDSRFGKNFYDECDGTYWCVAANGWWKVDILARQSLARRILFLTTETVPTVVAQRAAPSLHIYDLHAPKAPRHSVEVKTMPVKKETARDIVEELTPDFAVVISNHCKIPDPANTNIRIDIPGTMTHAAAKGNNGFIGKEVGHTMTYMAKELHCQFEVLNAWCDRTDLVWAAHMDEFNQTAGRNLGFRACDLSVAPRHLLVISQRLHTILVRNGALSHARYSIPTTVTSWAKKTSRAKLKDASPNSVACTERVESVTACAR